MDALPESDATPTSPDAAPAETPPAETARAETPVRDRAAIALAEGRSLSREVVLAQFMEASRLIVAIAARTIAAIDAEVSMPQYRMLVVLDLGGERRVSDLATELGVHPSTAGRMVERLVTKGLIRRQSGSDRRETLVRLTPRGVAFTSEATKARRAQFEEVLDHLNDRELVEVCRGLELVSRAGNDLGLTYLGEADAALPW